LAGKADLTQKDEGRPMNRVTFWSKGPGNFKRRYPPDTRKKKKKKWNMTSLSTKERRTINKKQIVAILMNR